MVSQSFVAAHEMTGISSNTTDAEHCSRMRDAEDDDNNTAVPDNSSRITKEATGTVTTPMNPPSSCSSRDDGYQYTIDPTTNRLHVFMHHDERHDTNNKRETSTNKNNHGGNNKGKSITTETNSKSYVVKDDRQTSKHQTTRQREEGRGGGGGEQEEEENNNDYPSSSSSSSYTIPETVLQYERQLRKVRALQCATAPLTPTKHLHVLYVDQHIIVVNKPSGVLCVPGLHDNPSVLTLVYDHFNDSENDSDDYRRKRDAMIVHRLDMDTSGVVIFARTSDALKGLHQAFRERKVEKYYEALLCGHMSVDGGEIDLPLQRDHRFPPFMRVSTRRSEKDAARAVEDLRHAGYKKLLRKNPKPSRTEFAVVQRECHGEGKHPATRVRLIPITGRTHQLRVHCAAIGHPIIADPAYGIFGEASPNGGFDDEDLMDSMAPPGRATLALQRDIDDAVQNNKEEEGGKGKRRMCLHAGKLRLDHPITGEKMVFEAPPPF